jgi:hypothetical protein
MAAAPADLAPTADDLDRRGTAIGLAIVLLIGAGLRLLPLLAHDWPLGDGGLFYAMIGDLMAAGPALPEVTSFQGGEIPFAYPPFAFYVGAALETAGLDRASILRYVPALLSVAAVGAMYLVAAELGPSRRHAVVATAFFGALIGITDVLSSGGGLTRSMGLLLALLATWRGLRLLRTPRALDVVLTAFLAGLAVLSHPQAGVFLVIALGSAWLTRWRTWRALAALIVAAFGSLLLMAPWLITVASRHGIETFRSAAGVPDRDLADAILAYLFLFLLTAPAIGVFDLLGQVQQALARRPHLLVWRVGVFALDLRFSPISGAAPASLLAAHGVLDVLVPATWRLVERSRGALSERQRVSWRRGVVVIAIGLGFIPAVTGSLESAGRAGALSPGEREAMFWVRDNTPTSTVTVSLARAPWGSDDVSEWFPALSERRSATTTQGFEWTRTERDTSLAAESALRTCQPQSTDTAACLHEWIAQQTPAAPLVVYVSRYTGGRVAADALIAGLIEDHGYTESWASDDGVLLGAPEG